MIRLAKVIDNPIIIRGDHGVYSITVKDIVYMPTKKYIVEYRHEEDDVYDHPSTFAATYKQLIEYLKKSINRPNQP